MSCPVALLAQQAALLIPKLDRDGTAREAIVEIEDLAPELRAKSREGAAFQLGLINTLTDTICSHVPETCPASSDAQATLAQIKKLVRSVQAVLGEPTTPAEREICDFYR